MARADAYLHTKWHVDPSNCLATIHQHHRQTDRTGQDRADRQRSDRIGRTVLQTVFQLEGAHRIGPSATRKRSSCVRNKYLLWPTIKGEALSEAVVRPSFRHIAASKHLIMQLSRHRRPGSDYFVKPKILMKSHWDNPTAAPLPWATEAIFNQYIAVCQRLRSDTRERDIDLWSACRKACDFFNDLSPYTSENVTHIIFAY